MSRGLRFVWALQFGGVALWKHLCEGWGGERACSKLGDGILLRQRHTWGLSRACVLWPYGRAFKSIITCLLWLCNFLFPFVHSFSHMLSLPPSLLTEKAENTIKFPTFCCWVGCLEREFPLDDARKESVSAKVLCIGTTVNINRLPHKYPGCGTKRLWKWGSSAPPPQPCLPRVLTNSLKEMTICLSSREASYGEESSCISAFR